MQSLLRLIFLICLVLYVAALPQYITLSNEVDEHRRLSLNPIPDEAVLISTGGDIDLLEQPKSNPNTPEDGTDTSSQPWLQAKFLNDQTSTTPEDQSSPKPVNTPSGDASQEIPSQSPYCIFSIQHRKRGKYYCCGPPQPALQNAVCQYHDEPLYPVLVKVPISPIQPTPNPNPNSDPNDFQNICGADDMLKGLCKRQIDESEVVSLYEV